MTSAKGKAEVKRQPRCMAQRVSDNLDLDLTQGHPDILKVFVDTDCQYDDDGTTTFYVFKDGSVLESQGQPWEQLEADTVFTPAEASDSAYLPEHVRQAAGEAING